MITNPIATSITIAVVLIAALRSLEVSRTTISERGTLAQLVSERRDKIEAFETDTRDNADWLRRQDIITGSPYWWDRYYACVGYDYH